MEHPPNDPIPEMLPSMKQDPESSPKKTSKSATSEQTSSSSFDKETPSRKKEFEEFKRLILDVPGRRLHDLSYKQVDELLKDQPHDMAERFKAAHRRAVHQKKGNSKLNRKTELDGAVDDFTRNTGLDPEHFPYEEYLRNDSLKATLSLVLLVVVLAFFAPFGVIYLGTHIAKGLKAMYPTKFSWLPL